MPRDRIPHPNEGRDSFERLEYWISFKIGRRITHDERGQLVNYVRAIMADCLSVARELVGIPREDE